jgi:hypothetical protein
MVSDELVGWFMEFERVGRRLLEQELVEPQLVVGSGVVAELVEPQLVV